MISMNQPRPILTAMCFVLFAMVFVSSNVRPAALFCEAIYGAEPGTLHDLAAEVKRVLHEASRPRRDN